MESAHESVPAPEPLMRLDGLSKTFWWRDAARPWRKAPLKAVDGVDLEIEQGECLAVVGESGSGKSTLARCMIRLLEPDEGSLHFAGEDLRALSRSELRRRRHLFQLVFQDAASAFNPRQRVASILTEPLRLRGVEKSEIARRVPRLLAEVGLDEAVATRYPNELSGGQRQRLGLARGLAAEPRLLILDEPVSALDMSVRSRILSLLLDLQHRLDLTLVMIAHDLAMVETIADRVAVLYLGRLIELASRDELFSRPQHPYTVGLLSAVPVPDPSHRRRLVVEGEVPSLLAPPTGCPFHPRCPSARDHCRGEMPSLRPVTATQQVACHFPGELTADMG